MPQKKLRQIYREERLQCALVASQARQREHRSEIPHCNQRWSLDLTSDPRTDGRRFPFSSWSTGLTSPSSAGGKLLLLRLYQPHRPASSLLTCAERSSAFAAREVRRQATPNGQRGKLRLVQAFVANEAL